MSKRLFTEGELRAFERMMQQMPRYSENNDADSENCGKGEDDKEKEQ